MKKIASISPQRIPSGVWPQFLRVLLSFTEEIEDRIPGYFKANPLRIDLSPGSGHAVQSKECSHVLNPRSVSLESYFLAIEEAMGVKLISAQKEDLNTIDQLFGRWIYQLLPYLQAESAFSCDQALKYSQSHDAAYDLDVRETVLSAIAACQTENDHKKKNHARIWSLLEKRQVCRSDGTVLNYYVGGRGTRPLVVLNAFGQGFGYWTRFLGEVFKDYQLVLWLPRGNSFESVGLQSSSPIDIHADDLRTILEQEKIRSCNLLAWCSGPKLALEYFLKYPTTVASMVFVAGSFKGLAEHRPLETVYEKGLESLLGLVQQQPNMAGLMIEALKKVLLAQNQSGGAVSVLGLRPQERLSSVNSTLKDMVCEPFHSSETVLAYARQLRNFWDTNFIGSINDIQAPVLFVGGDCDRIASQEISKQIAQLMPRARYAEVAGGSHYIQYSYPELLAGIMKTFLEGGIQFSFHHPWVNISEVNTEDRVRRARNDRKDYDRGENQSNISGNKTAPVPSHGAGIC